MKKIIILWLFSFVATADVLSTSPDKLIDQQIYTMTSTVDPSYQQCDVTKYPTIQINADYVGKMVTLIGCGGGNHFEQYFVIVKHDRNGWKIKQVDLVGSDHEFVVESIKANPHGYTLIGNKFGPEDGHCCPSVPFTIPVYID